MVCVYSAVIYLKHNVTYWGEMEQGRGDKVRNQTSEYDLICRFDFQPYKCLND